MTWGRYSGYFFNVYDRKPGRQVWKKSHTLGPYPSREVAERAAWWEVKMEWRRVGKIYQKEKPVRF